MRVIALAGLPGAGKDSVALLLEQRGFGLFRFSDEVRAEAITRGLREPTREQLQRIGDELRDAFGPGVLGTRIAMRIIVSGSEHAVANGVRHLGEWAELRERLGGTTLLVGVEAPFELRRRRVLDRGREGDPRTPAAFAEIDARDRGDEGSSAHLQVGEVLASCDVTLWNESTLVALESRVDKLARTGR